MTKTANAHTLTEDDMAVLRVAKRFHCIRSGSCFATPTQVLKLCALGLMESIEGISYALTEKGKKTVGDNHDA